MSYRQVYIQAETLQKLIDFAHAAMRKREDEPDEFVVVQSRNKQAGGHAELSAKDLREVQRLGKPSWESAAKTTPEPVVRHDPDPDMCYECGNQRTVDYGWGPTACPICTEP